MSRTQKKEKKFTRCANFSSSDENNLISIVNKYKHILECRKTDETPANVKRDIWQTIEKEFNAVSHIYRDEKILKTKYENIKKRVKQKFSDEKKYVHGTGGGPFKEAKFTHAEESIKEILGYRLTGMTSHFDNDGNLDLEIINCGEIDEPTEISSSVHLIHNYALQEEEIVLPCRSQDMLTNALQDESKSPDPDFRKVPSEAVPENTKWDTYTPKMLKSKKSSLLQGGVKSNGKNTLDGQLSSWASAKSDLVDLQKTVLKNEHEARLKQMQEKHEHSMKVEVKEMEERMKMLREEHLLKMEILNIQKSRLLQ